MTIDYSLMFVTDERIVDELLFLTIVNDRVDIALAVDADGVHMGQTDMPVRVVRRLLDAIKY